MPHNPVSVPVVISAPRRSGLLTGRGADHSRAPSVGYDECVERLAHTVDHHDDAELEEVAYLIGQLAVVIE